MKTVAFTLRMTPELRETIKARAQAVQITDSAWVTMAIYRALPPGSMSASELWAELSALMASEHELKSEESTND